jgi:hypothetical protein
MSDIAVTWAKAQTCPDRSSKQVLVDLAGYADATGETWAMVPVLAFESQTTDRTIQRALRALEEAGLLRRTGRSKTYYGRVMPIYKLPLDTGPANTRDAMRALGDGSWGDARVTPRKPGKPSERPNDAPDPAASPSRSKAATPRRSGAVEAVHPMSRGDVGVTPDASLGVTRVTPQDDTHDTPRGDTGVTQIGKGIYQGLKPSASVCAKAQRLWGSKAPERVSPVRVAASWDEAIRRTGVQAEPLLAAVTAAVRRDPDFGRGKAMNLDRWLAEDRFLPWLNDADETTAARAAWSGPDDVRRAVVSAMGESGAAAYLDPARWDDGRRVIVARTALAVERLKAGARSAFRGMNITVECEAKRG